MGDGDMPVIEGFRQEDEASKITTSSGAQEIPMDSVEGLSGNTKGQRPFERLPQELLIHIISYLDSPAPSASKLKSQPSFGITENKGQDFLKSASAVSWRWRKTALPLLFKNVCLIVDHERSPIESLRATYVALFDFIEQHNFKPAVETFTLCIKGNKALYDGDNEIRLRGAGSLWPRLIDALGPSKVTILAPPEILGLFAHCRARSEDGWLFEMEYHLLHVSLEKAESSSQKNKSLTAAKNTANNVTGQEDSSLENGDEGIHGNSVRDENLFGVPSPLTLLGSRPWTSMLLNEGSFIKGFSTYEYFHRMPSGILRNLLGWDISVPLTADEDSTSVALSNAMVPPTVRDFSYIAVFPYQTHFQFLTTRLPRLERLYVQFTPQDDILKDPDLIRRIDTRDLWMERNHCYTMIMQQLFQQPPSGNFQHLEVFESGDAADEDAWEMAVQFVERQGGWKAESPGVFVKKPKEEKNRDEEEEETGHMNAFQGALRRWAFNGTAKLPVSSASLYRV